MPAFAPALCSEGCVTVPGRAGRTVGTATADKACLSGVSGTFSGGVGGESAARPPEGLGGQRLTVGVGDKVAGVTSADAASGARGRGGGVGNRFFTLATRTACAIPSFQTASVSRSRPATASARNLVVEKGPNHLPSLTTCNKSLMFRYHLGGDERPAGGEAFACWMVRLIRWQARGGRSDKECGHPASCVIKATTPRRVKQEPRKFSLRSAPPRACLPSPQPPDP